MKTIFQLIEEHGLKGLKVRHISWGFSQYIVYLNGIWLDEENNNVFYPDCIDTACWEIYTEKPKSLKFDDIKLGQRIKDHDSDILEVIYTEPDFIITLFRAGKDTNTWEKDSERDQRLMALWQPID